MPALAEHFLSQIRPLKEDAVWQLSEAARGELCSRPWAGNVRELRNVIDHAAIVARGGEIRPEHLPPPARLTADEPVPASERARKQIAEWSADEALRLGATDDPQLYEAFLQLVEPPLLEAALRQCEGNRAAAAQLLGLHRATLRQKMRRYGISD